MYAVWYSMLRSDTPQAFPAARQMLPDRRVSHIWDSDKAVGRWFKENITPEYERMVIWDVYYLYDAEAEWKDRPSRLLGWGRPVFNERLKLAEEIARLPRR